MVLKVFAKLRHKGRPHFLLILPDGSKSRIPVAWTDFAGTPANSAPSCSLLASATDLLRLRQRVDWLLRRIEAGGHNDQPSPIPEIQDDTSPTRVVERGTSSHSPRLPSAPH